MQAALCNVLARTPSVEMPFACALDAATTAKVGCSSSSAGQMNLTATKTIFFMT